MPCGAPMPAYRFRVVVEHRAPGSMNSTRGYGQSSSSDRRSPVPGSDAGCRSGGVRFYRSAILVAMATGGRLQRTLEKYLFNPPNRMLLRIGIAPRAFALLETRGRRTGQPRLTPVGNGLDGSTFWVVA